MTHPLKIHNQMLTYVSGEIQKAMDICPKCGEKQWSIADKNYLKEFKHCWSCDKREWENGNLSLAEFEKRELYASRV